MYLFSFENTVIHSKYTLLPAEFKIYITLGSKILPDGGKQNYEGFIVMNVFAYTYCSACL